MDPYMQRVLLARSVRNASDFLFEASERAHDLNRAQLSLELLDRALDSMNIAQELLDIARQPAPRPYGSEDLPF